MLREEKEKQVKELSEAFKTCHSFYIVDYLKMPVSQFTELRKLFRERSYTFKVIKNRLALRALKDKFPEELKKYFQGTTAIAFAPQDPVGLARLIKNYAEQNKALTVKAGLIEGQFIPAERFNEVATLAPREVLLARLGYAMAYPLVRILRTWQAPTLSLGRLLSQLKNKK